MTFDAASTLHANASGPSHANAFGVERVGRFIRGVGEHAFGVAHASTDATPNREAIPERSRGLRRFAATPGDNARERMNPEGVSVQAHQSVLLRAVRRCGR